MIESVFSMTKEINKIFLLLLSLSSSSLLLIGETNDDPNLCHFSMVLTNNLQYTLLG